MEKSNENKEDLGKISTAEQKSVKENNSVTEQDTAVEQESVVQVDSEEERNVEPEGHTAESSAKNADQLINEARDMVNQSDLEVKDCMEILDEDITAYEEAKSSLTEGSMRKNETLLSEVGFEPEEIDSTAEDAVKFGSEEPIKPMQVKSLSSGKFSAFILALIAGIAVIAGWVFVATEKLGTTLYLDRVPSQEAQNKLLSWIGGGMTGGEGNPMVGMVILGLSALIAMWAVYSLRVYLREAHNQKLAQKVNEEAKFYCTQKEECKKEMEKVSEHIHKVITSLHTYDIYFNELNATMERIIYLEGKIPFNEYHLKSKEEMKGATILVNSLNELISTPMAGENGSLSKESSKILERSNRTLEHYREKLYQ
ncbi:MAG: hypothetical protein U9R26_04300 [Campylobacterota bacterium]|nr:hypothetical protein [Campylobacterota bacterium]